MISKTFTDSGENWAKTARSLGIDQGNLHHLVKRLGMK
jgi:anaerobic nitric oxide reductase transcription regulator